MTRRKLENASLMAKQSKLQSEINNLLQLATNAQSNEKVRKLVLQQIEDHSNEKDQAEAKIRQLKEQKVNSTTGQINLKDAQEFFKMFSQNIKRLNSHQQKEAIWSVVKSVKVSNELITVELYGGCQPSFKKINQLDNLINTAHNSDMDLARTKSGSYNGSMSPPFAHMCKNCPHPCKGNEDFF